MGTSCLKTMIRHKTLFFALFLALNQLSDSAMFKWGRSDFPGWMQDLRRFQQFDADIGATITPDWRSEVGIEDEDPESFVLMNLLEQINKRQGKRDVPEKRSGNFFKKMYNVELLRRLSGGLFDMSYLNDQVSRQNHNIY